MVAIKTIRALLDTSPNGTRPMVVRCMSGTAAKSRVPQAVARSRSWPKRAVTAGSGRSSRPILARARGARAWTEGDPDIDTRGTSSRCWRRRAARVRATPSRWNGTARSLTAATSTPRSPVVPGRSDAGRRASPRRPAAAGPTGRALARRRGGHQPLRPADRAGPWRRPSGRSSRSIRRSRCSTAFASRCGAGMENVRAGRGALAGGGSIDVRDGCRAHGPCRLRHRIDRALPRRDGDGRRSAVCSNADGAPAVVDRRCCWPAVHGEARVSLPALPDSIERLRARGREPAIEQLERKPRRFASRDELEGTFGASCGSSPGAKRTAGSEAPWTRSSCPTKRPRRPQGPATAPDGIVPSEPGGTA